MTSHITTISLAHELDAAWILGLWKAIHGGDPVPIEADARSVALVAELSNHLSGSSVGKAAQPLSRQNFGPRLAELGIQVQRAEPQPQPDPPPYCFSFRGASYCVHFPHKVFSLE